MRPINTNEKSRLVASQVDTFNDICQIGVYSESTNSYKELIKTWTYGSTIACGFELLDGYERISGVVTFTGIQARVRLSPLSNLTTKDKIKFSGVEYSVKSIKGKYCLVVDLEAVST